MGCCASTPSGAGTQGSGVVPGSSSSAAIISHQPQVAPERPSTQTSVVSHRTRNRHESAVDAEPPRYKHVNKPLKRHVWEMKPEGHQWTRHTLDTERTEFFDTRVSGREEIWQTIHSALAVLYSGGDEGDEDGGLATAQEILNAAQVSLPTGNLSNGAYDAWGQFYQIPQHIAADPTNLGVGITSADVADDKEEGSKSEDSEELSDETFRRREAKGKAVIDPHDSVALRARRSDGVAVDLVITVSKKDSIKLIARRLKLKAELQPKQQVNIFFLGKRLDEKKTLKEAGWKEGCVVNAYISG